MKSQTNIESMFQNAEKKLTITPSEKAWQQLENKLEQKPINGKVVSMYKWMAIAASLIVLVYSTLFVGNSNQMELDYMPTIVEEIGNETDCNPYCLLLEGRNSLPSYYAAPVKSEWN